MLNSTTATPPSSNTAGVASLAALLQADQVSCEILRFLLANESAMDTAKGIAAWWLHLDELAVQPSLHRLFACGAILAHTLSSGATIYGLTLDPELRTWLRNTLGAPHDARTGGDLPADREDPQRARPLPESR